LAIARQRATDLIRIYLLLHRDTIRTQNIDALVWVIEQVSEALLLRYVLDQPPSPATNSWQSQPTSPPDSSSPNRTPPPASDNVGGQPMTDSDNGPP
jgi:hypothetical protein